MFHLLKTAKTKSVPDRRAANMKSVTERQMERRTDRRTTEQLRQKERCLVGMKKYSPKGVLVTYSEICASYLNSTAFPNRITSVKFMIEIGYLLYCFMYIIFSFLSFIFILSAFVL